MVNQNFNQNYNHREFSKINNQFTGIINLTEPIIVAGKYFGIRLLSTYEFMKCIKMRDNLVEEIINEGFDKQFCKKIWEYACFVSMCLYNSKNNHVFENGMEALKHLTPEELSYIYEEYLKLLNKVTRKDNITHNIVEKAKKYYYQKEKCL